MTHFAEVFAKIFLTNFKNKTAVNSKNIKLTPVFLV